MSEITIRRAFESRLKNWADAQTPPIPLAFENIPFDPPSATYLSCFLINANNISFTLDRRHIRYSGIFQINVHVPVNTGAGLPAEIAAALRTIFNPSTVIVQNSANIYVMQPLSIGPSIQEGDFFFVPLSIEYSLDS